MEGGIGRRARKLEIRMGDVPYCETLDVPYCETLDPV
jgi:hypothetical protein